jgi:hypothetical protein
MDFVLFLGALICFAVAAFASRPNPPGWWAPALVPLGLFLCALDWFIHAARHMNG